MTSSERGRRKYDELAGRYEEVFPYVAAVGRQLVDYVDPPAGSRVLDVGAGRGAVVRAALDRGCVVTATDASQGMVDRLATDFPQVTAVQMDAGQLKFPAASFDLVTAGFVVQVLDDPARALAEARRVLAPGGTVAMSLEKQSVGRLGWLYELAGEFFGIPVPSDDDEQNGALTSRQLDDLLRAAGFGDLQTVPVDMPVRLADPEALWDWLGTRGLADAVGQLSPARAADFKARFLAGAERMGDIVLDFRATLHKATR
jgi:SAM-dependent methyltransferase